jgi:hypothetical protein
MSQDIAVTDVVGHDSDRFVALAPFLVIMLRNVGAAEASEPCAGAEKFATCDKWPAFEH